SAPGLHGSWYWKVPATEAEQVVSEEVTVTSTGEPTLISVPAAVPAGQAGAVALLSGAVTGTEDAVGAETRGTGLPALVTAGVVIGRVVPGGPEAGLTEVIVGLVIRTMYVKFGPDLVSPELMLVTTAGPDRSEQAFKNGVPGSTSSSVAETEMTCAGMPARV